MENPAAFESAIRGPDAYRLARSALENMVRHKVWPTPVNFELWLRTVADPQSVLAQEVCRLVANDEPFTEATCEALAAAYLTKERLNDQISNAGNQLGRELNTVSKAIQAAQRSTAAYGVTLADAGAELAQKKDSESLRNLVSGLTAATRQAEEENKALQKQIKDSTTEIYQLRANLAQVRRDATTDALTNLANRKAYDTELQLKFEISERTGAPITLAVIDIDNFKRFNDTWGHQTGDQVLRYVASIIGRVGAAPRFAARYGGEEFALIFPGETAEAVQTLLIDVLKEIGSSALRRRSSNEELGVITVSAGVAQLKDGESAHALMGRADAALYVSKRAGRNRSTNAEAIKDVEAA
jgi:diguanylate cyclase